MFLASSWSALWVEPNGMERIHPTAIGSGSKLHLLRTGLVGCHLFRMRAEDRSETGLHWESTQGHLACSVGVMRWLAHIHFRRKNWGSGSSKCVFLQPHCRPGQPPIESRNCWTNPIRWLPGPWNPKEPLEAVLPRRGLPLWRVESILVKSTSLWSWAGIWKSPASGQVGRSGPNRFNASRFWPIVARSSRHTAPTGRADFRRSRWAAFTPALWRAADAPDRL